MPDILYKSGSKLFGKVTSRQQKSPMDRFRCWDKGGGGGGGGGGGTPLPGNSQVVIGVQRNTHCSSLENQLLVLPSVKYADDQQKKHARTPLPP